MTVCTGNICRSPMGEYLIKQAATQAGLTVEVASSGISNEEKGNPIDRRAKKVLDELNINTGSHKAKQFTRADFDRYDLLLAMDTNHYRELKRLAPNDEAASKVRLMREFDPALTDKPLDQLGIYDPWYGNMSDFYETFQMIQNAVPGVIEHAQTHHN
ncbi:MAG: low molecular weight protein-tyrosine-phosphatase [Rothia sp. (in: high G+C Gram-positive bacteria)]|nr:low molecular weight protein-tyrosine-phosphatase [Rothia sp. (in: high G+C Gram-positive bacteria)]